MLRSVLTVLAGAMLFACKPAASPTPAPAVADTFTPTPAPAPEVPASVLDNLPVVSGTLPKVPANALRVVVGWDTVKVGDTGVAQLDEGFIGETGALVRAMTVAGSANRPVAIYVHDGSVAQSIVAVTSAAQDSGANVVGLVARTGEDVFGWFPVREAVLGEDGVPTVRLESDMSEFTTLASDAWASADGSHRLAVSVHPFMKAKDLYNALHELRGPQCASQPGSCRFAALGITNDAPRLSDEGRMPMPSSGEGTIGLGNTGLVGTGGGGGAGSGYGRGSGSGFGGRGKRVPRVRQGKALVGSGLDKDIVRRIVRAHINEVRYCYNQGLTKDPELNGKVLVDFTIAATGKVDKSGVKSTTLSDANVAICVAKAVKRWKFPKPAGGNEVDVVYPFVLEPG